ncbi:fumarylacetoacetate hydrolase family protein [Aurantimicrobium photophilum]|uniref:Ureidoglycolate lyase n=1 Tax=Aurantimicrobium photophilum TaxID=1987356 RepID=A0A2Z3RVM5_9MICO|nr:fumarylacetoacetate hydrolase family protein [Aurantimicrobium photophilum]AWR20681.1 Ureidoglycolate lyase [Aurantimicrobium photophilum]
MRIARYQHNGFPHLGVIRDGKILSLQTNLTLLEVLALPRRERDYLEGQAGKYFRAPADSVKYLTPVEPRAMRDFLSFEAHVAGMKKSFDGDGTIPDAWFEAPGFYFMNPWATSGSTDDIPMPPLTKRLDFELEMAVVILKEARDVSVEEAGDYIAGYCIFNDWSARDIQANEMKVGLGPNKGKDFNNTFGPWITTPDELEQYRDGDRYDLEMVVKVNGVEYGRDSCKNMSWSFEELISHASRGTVVGAGDVLASGTAGMGAMSEHWSRSKQNETPAPLQVGDVVEMTIEGLGMLCNTVTECVSPGHTVPRARRTYSEDRL